LFEVNETQLTNDVSNWIKDDFLNAKLPN